jgi:mannosyltransferase OCH1-like enzyme
MEETKLMFGQEELKIPKIIHHVWFDMGNGTTVPEKYDKMMKSKKTFMPEKSSSNPDGWTYVLWDEKMAMELLESEYSWFVPYFTTYKNPICKVDAIRYFILHRYGGVYMDQDLLLHKSIEPALMGHEVVLVKGSFVSNVLNINQKNVELYDQDKINVNNYFLAAVSGHPFFEHVIYQLVGFHQAWYHIKGSAISVLKVTGPKFLSKCIESFKQISDPEQDYRIHVLPQMSFFNQSLVERVFSMDANDSDQWFYGTHEYHASWFGWQKKKWWLAGGGFLILVLLIVTIVMVKKRKTKL